MSEISSASSRSRLPLIGLAVGTAARHFREVARGVMDYARQHTAWRFIFLIEDRPVEGTGPRGIDGLIAGFTTPEEYHHPDRATVPTINVSGSLPDVSGLPTVRLDDQALGRMAATHFLEQGFRQAAFYRRGPGRTDIQRCLGFTRTMEAAGVKSEVFDVTAAGSGRLPDEWALFQKWIQDLPKPIALFARNDYEGRLVNQCCFELGIGVPEEVAVIGVDNDDLFTEIAHPPLSSIETGARRIGYEAASILDRMLAGEPPPEVPIEFPPLHLVSRQSSDVLAIEDLIVARAMRYIAEHACQGWNVGDVLRHVPLSRRQLELRFRRQLGRTPHAEIIRVRLNTARRLLAETDLSVDAIAQRCGFGYAQNLSKAMRQADGQSPAAWRSRLRGR
ncbi:MAG: DNA-binding transcriptional regulator [Phycisphaeraceae bacterium]|nr:DNA-binding transcriptional regulator [Phycisphaeraceae bacterium]